MAELRITNNSTVDPATITGAWSSGSSVRVTFADGTARTYRWVQLTPEGRELLTNLSKDQANDDVH